MSVYSQRLRNPNMPFLHCYVDTLLAITGGEVALTDVKMGGAHTGILLVIARLASSAVAIPGWETWAKLELNPFLCKPEVAFAYYLT